MESCSGSAPWLSPVIIAEVFAYVHGLGTFSFLLHTSINHVWHIPQDALAFFGLLGVAVSAAALSRGPWSTRLEGSYRIFGASAMQVLLAKRYRAFWLLG